MRITWLATLLLTLSVNIPKYNRFHQLLTVRVLVRLRRSWLRPADSRGLRVGPVGVGALLGHVRRGGRPGGQQGGLAPRQARRQGVRGEGNHEQALQLLSVHR